MEIHVASNYNHQLWPWPLDVHRSMEILMILVLIQLVTNPPISCTRRFAHHCCLPLQGYISGVTMCPCTQPRELRQRRTDLQLDATHCALHMRRCRSAPKSNIQNTTWFVVPRKQCGDLGKCERRCWSPWCARWGDGRRGKHETCILTTGNIIHAHMHIHSTFIVTCMQRCLYT